MSKTSEMEQEAARWLIRREEPDWSESDQSELESWLNESMAHKAAFWRLESGWAAADRVRSLASSYRSRGASRMPWLASKRSWAIGSGIAAALALTLTLTLDIRSATEETLPVSVMPSRIVMGKFETEKGMQQDLPLPDGSKVELNTETEVRTAIGNKTREVWLDKGEAYFEVAHREGLPFIVYVGRQKVTVVGTKFSVHREGDKVTVLVLEGRVRIGDALDKTAAPPVIVSAGDVAFTRESSMLVTRPGLQKIEETLAWRGGFLHFDQMTLRQAAAEFNRYNQRKIEITDEETAQIRIGGTFRVTNADSFVRLLGEAYGLKIVEEPDIVKISGK